MLYCFIYRIFVETSWIIKLKERIEEIRLSPHEFAKIKDDLLSFAEQRFSIRPNSLKKATILRKSIDARKKDIKYNLKLSLKFESTKEESYNTYPENLRISAEKVHIVGFGPAGIFAAIKLLQQGIKPVIFERGKAVKARRRDVAKLNRDGEMNPESNYCYGEGGAGTFSDGKLYTRSHKRGKISDILNTLVEFGADPSILYEAHPHIGTNKLPQIIENLRKGIIKAGGEVHFNSKLNHIEIKDGKIISICINEQVIPCDNLILATGHSARDIYYMLNDLAVRLEAKPFAMGFRIEHPQSLVDQIQYHGQSTEFLPSASYSLVEQQRGKGVFSFCMCPGGIIAPAATKEGEVVVNGWSPSKRNGPYANSGWVTEIGEEEWKEYNEHGALAGLKFQEDIERKAYEMGGGDFKVPAQNLRDYLAEKLSKALNPCSYHPGTKSVDLNQLYPEEINYRLREGLRASCKKLKGFDHEKAVVVAPESRTSAPVRIPRNLELEHPEITGLYPCGEGAGFAGGIISAALDGQRVASAIGSKKK